MTVTDKRTEYYTKSEKCAGDKVYTIKKGKGAVKELQSKLKKSILQLISEGNFIKTACEKINITRKTFYEWKLKDKNFAEAVEIASQGQDGMVEDALYQSALKGNVIAQIFWLCNRNKKRWKNIQTMKHEGACDKPIMFRIVDAGKQVDARKDKEPKK